LKEAAIVYKHRHHAIVEIVALFQGDDGNTFYMQMPWYENESLDKWVCGDQLPAWPKVRSVLLDALVGVSHLHFNKIIHGDVYSNYACNARRLDREFCCTGAHGR